MTSVLFQQQKERISDLGVVVLLGRLKRLTEGEGREGGG